MPGATSEPFAVDTKTAADLLGVSKSHLEKLRVEKPEDSPPYIKVGRCIRYPIESLREWIAEAASTAERQRETFPSHNNERKKNDGRSIRHSG